MESYAITTNGGRDVKISVKDPGHETASKATPARAFFNVSISSRIKQMLQRKRNATTSAEPQDEENGIAEDHGKSSSEVENGTEDCDKSTSEVEITSASTSSASTSASTSGSESSSPKDAPAASRRGMSLLERIMPRKQKPQPVAPAKPREPIVEYVLFDMEGRPAWTQRARHPGEGPDSDGEPEPLLIVPPELWTSDTINGPIIEPAEKTDIKPAEETTLTTPVIQE